MSGMGTRLLGTLRRGIAVQQIQKKSRGFCSGCQCISRDFCAVTHAGYNPRYCVRCEDRSYISGFGSGGTWNEAVDEGLVRGVNSHGLGRPLVCKRESKSTAKRHTRYPCMSDSDNRESTKVLLASRSCSVAFRVGIMPPVQSPWQPSQTVWCRLSL